MKFNSTDLLSGYFSTGMYCFDAGDILQNVAIDKLLEAELTKGDETLQAQEKQAKQALGLQDLKLCLSQLLSEFEHELAYDFMTSFVNENVQKWHVDTQYVLPHQNTTVNCFFDDTSIELGGSFSMQPWSATPFAEGPKVTTVYPKKNQIIIFNQNRNFIHRAGANLVPRRMISFACDLKHINPIQENFPN
jgi:hypothetical protein